ncbi:MAG: TonB-dependent receptor [Gammaproteobacteria bacterium]|nr:TonB-dependent receptor [Gammaproteobacteria bacterium]
MKNHFKFLSGVFVPSAAFAVLGLCVIGTQTVRADESESASDDEIEEVLVTARKREESLLEIPESVAVITGGDIDRQGIKGLEEIGFQVPNLNLSTRLDGFPNVSIRGLGAFGNTQGAGFYLDDVQIFSDASSRFGDLDRIEILKGPQGTLYGGSNIGGAVKFVSARPDSEDRFGRVKATVGDQGIVDLEGSLNAPMDNDWGARLFGFTVTNDGYLENPNSARANGLRNDNDPDVGASEEWGFRISLAGPVTEGMSVYTSVRWNEFEGPNNTWVRELDTSLDHPNIVDTTTNARHERRTRSAMVEVTWELGTFDVVSVSSHTKTASDRYSDLDISQEYLLDLFRPEEMEVITQEVRVATTGDGPTQWLGGVYYSRYDETMDADLIWFNTLATPDDMFTGPLGCALDMPTCSGVWAGETLGLGEETRTLRTPFEKRNREKSHFGAFANATYSVDNWEFSAGLRLDQWSNDTENWDTGLLGDQSGTEVLPRVSATLWLDDNSMVYGTVSRGYEPGGFNLTNFEGQSELFGFDPEEATSLEGGWKGRLMDGTVSAEVAVFYIDYSSRQIEYQATGSDGGVIEGIINLGDSTQSGIEGAVEMRVSDELTLSAALGVVNAEWDSGVEAAGVDLGGSTPPVVPDLSWNLGLDYRRPMGGLDFIAGVQVSHNGEYEGLQAWNPVTNPAFTIVNAQVGFAKESWELMLNVENLTDEAYYTDVQHFPNYYLLDGGESVVIGTLGQPQLLTASFSYFF